MARERAEPLLSRAEADRSQRVGAYGLKIPRIARLEDPTGVWEVSIESLKIGDTVFIRPGDRVPSDAEVIEGQSEVDEAPITGESVPAPKGVGDAVYVGSINAIGVLRARVTHTAADNTLARIIHLVEEAQAAKAPTARFIDRFAAYYTPAAMAAALLIVVVPPLGFRADWRTWIYRGLATLLIVKMKQAGPVAMVGDGINDAPALASANIGIAAGGGSEVALETADAALLNNRVQGVAEMVALARATISNIWQNNALALGLKAIFLTTTFTGTTSLWMAILADTGATVLVTANALRLLGFRTAERSVFREGADENR